MTYFIIGLICGWFLKPFLDTVSSIFSNAWNKTYGKNQICKGYSNGTPLKYPVCYKCKESSKSHVTPYIKSTSFEAGLSVLCEKCWGSLTPENRLPFYEELWKEWVKMDKDISHVKWEQIKKAVMDGL